MLFKQLTCVGISEEREAGESVQYLSLVILLGREKGKRGAETWGFHESPNFPKNFSI